MVKKEKLVKRVQLELKVFKVTKVKLATLEKMVKPVIQVNRVFKEILVHKD